MRKCCALLFTVGIVLSTLAAANAEELKVTVPFNFVVNGKTLPAATYTIRESLRTNKADLAFVGQGASALAMATELDTSVTGTRLVFHRIGDQYFLSDVVSLDGTLHFAVSHSEAQLARSMNRAPVATAGN